jgi:hypothetical protein
MAKGSRKDGEERNELAIQAKQNVRLSHQYLSLLMSSAPRPTFPVQTSFPYLDARIHDRIHASTHLPQSCSAVFHLPSS